MSAERLCPHCKVALTATRLLDGLCLEVECCPQCRGVWFDASELQTVLDAAKDPQSRLDRQLLDALAARSDRPQDVRYVPCPVCSEVMNRCSHGHRSGVVVDRCTPHGVWLDGGELETLFEWMAAGGHVLDAQVAEERRQEACRDEERRQHAMELQAFGDSTATAVSHPRHRPGGWLADALADLLGRFVR